MMSVVSIFEYFSAFCSAKFSSCKIANHKISFKLLIFELNVQVHIKQTGGKKAQKIKWTGPIYAWIGGKNSERN